VDGFVVGELPEAGEEQPPIEPTLEKQLEESIEIVEQKKAAGRKGGKPGREPKKSPKDPPPAAPGVPKAAIPPAPKIDDPVLTVTQQTLIVNAAMQSGWKIPEEFNDMLQKKYKLKSIREARNSQFDELLRRAKGDSST
jgi:hypothetical protein